MLEMLVVIMLVSSIRLNEDKYARIVNYVGDLINQLTYTLALARPLRAESEGNSVYWIIFLMQTYATADDKETG